MRLLLALALASLPALAQSAAATPDGGVADAGESDAQAEKEMEQALGKDAKAAQAQGQQGSAPAAATHGTPPPPANLARGSQSLNPDISAILDADFGYQRRAPGLQNGDDPDLRADARTHAVGFTAQEVEIAASAIVDPYFKGEVYLTIPNLSGLEVEEAFATTTSLPANLQVKMGSFRGAFGRQNGQHLHVQDFTRRPLINAAFLGQDGMRGPGAQVSWLSPLPFYLTLYGEAFSLRSDAPSGSPGDPSPPVATFGGGSPSDLTYAAEAKVFFPFGDEWSLYGGLNFATGVSPGLFVFPDNAAAFSLAAHRRASLFGGDLYVKWKPANIAGGYESLTWQSEAIFRRFESKDGLDAEWDGGLYSQVVFQVARRWFLGARGDLIGLPTSSVVGRVLRGSLSATFQLSEFARLRGYVEVEKADAAVGYGNLPGGYLFPSPAVPTSPSAFLQLEISIGAHGAHAF